MKIIQEMNLPNKLTLLRFCLVPVFIACFYIPVSWNNYIAAGLFVLAYITDIVDGYIARKKNQVTDFGKLMDPIADKALTASALFMMTAFDYIHPVFPIIIIVREFLVSGFRMVSAGSGVVIAANWIGKLKTLTQCIAIVMILLQDLVIRIFGFRLDLVMLWISIALTIWSAADYIYTNRQVMIKKEEEK